ncbi:MAG: hypothetical protein Q9198_000911 [Flavoplaca austrocitrina]
MAYSLGWVTDMTGKVSLSNGKRILRETGGTGRDVTDGPSDIADEATGLNRRHPKVFVGFFSHASFPEIYKSRKTAFNAVCPDFKGLLGNEYRYTVESLSYKTDHNVDTHIGVTIGGVYHAWKTFVQLAILTVRLLPT